MPTSSAIDKNCLATARWTLTHDSAQGRHTETLFARRMNFWRDILVPEELKEKLMGARAGESLTMAFLPGSMLPMQNQKLLRRIPRRQFLRKRVGERIIQPRVGRWYPQGMLSGLRGVNPSTLLPFRILELDEDELLINMNHPLAGVMLSLQVDVLDVAASQCETGGRLHHWTETLCEGPGIQRPLPNTSVDFLQAEDLRREDEGDDSRFYTESRLVSHIDTACQERLAALYAKLLQPGMAVLDCMSSWQSHLPDALELGEVVGLGMNAAELEANPRLTERLTHDLNADSAIPLSDARFDAVLCAMSVEYLTKPQAVVAEMARVLKPGGVCVLSVSQRWFPPKAIALWPELHPFERLGYMAWLLEEAQAFDPLETYSDRGHPRPREDRYFPQLRESDPLFLVWAQKRLDG